VLRFAWAYQGGSGTTYLAGGATVNVSGPKDGLSVMPGSQVILDEGAVSVNVKAPRKALDIKYDRNSVDL
jgi:hypothetical protein